MFNFFWVSIATPIAVALFTTLAVEYFAKPQLDARKERLLTDRRNLDELIYRFQKLALSLGSIPPLPGVGKTEHDLMGAMREQAVAQAFTDARDTSDALSRLSPRYTERHHPHITRTALFLGYITGVAATGKRDVQYATTELAPLGGYLELFDVYFRANVGLQDSQEPWIRRWFWRHSSAGEYEAAAQRKIQELGLME
ncbi:hypothetical protein [Glaciihabitans sp. dw_435]|uniref:hypothetical protein n=1 Tax=Glaciihabitans sp. dw_435 TaxID=2720081 RepID=UPI001BD51DF5|nr:hypothetical protein [Glaciihabitans sp. dw_435]